MTKNGYRSPEGKDIQAGHISRILNGSSTSFLAPEPEVKEEEQATSVGCHTSAPRSDVTPSPPLVALSYQEPVAVPLEETEREEALRELHAENRKILKAELEDEEEERKLKEAELPALVPSPSDHSRAEHAHPQQLARVTGIFTRRGSPPELEEEKVYYGIPAMQRKSSTTITRPHEVTHFGSNVLSTRDLSVRQKKRS